MIRSMTGFGRYEKTDNGWRCGVELRSVNGRFLEIRMKLPTGLYHLEENLKKVIQQGCARGKFDCTITLTPENHDKSSLVINETLLKQYAQLLGALRKTLDADVQVTLGNLTNIKDLILTNQIVEEGEETQGLLKETLGAAVNDLVSMREREGAALKTVMEERIATIRGIAEELGPLTAEIPQLAAKRLRENLKRLMAPGKPDEDRIFQEIAILADRYDVSEEITRLGTHLDHLEQMLLQGGAVGRKFDFLLQEINREANTLASKSTQVPVSSRVVEIKSELEKLREQIQNVE